MSNLELVRHYWEKEAKGDLDGIMECYHPDATFKAPISDQLEGTEALRAFYAELLEGDAESTVEVDRTTEEGERIAVEFTLHFDLGGGKTGSLQGCNVFTIRDGKFQDVRSYFNPADFSA
jgi:ketosteroid isomerase-like protein